MRLLWFLSLWFLWNGTIAFRDNLAQLATEKRRNYFNFELFQKVNQKSEGNVIVSPVGVKTALTVLAGATHGNTYGEIVSLLRTQNNPLHPTRTQKALLTEASKNFTELKIATRLWLDYSVFVQQIVNILRLYPHTDYKQMDLKNSDELMERMHKWIRNATEHNDYMFEKSVDVDANTTLLLTSATYFKGIWLKSFKPYNTHLECFYDSKGTCRKTYMMQATSTYRYIVAHSLEAEVVEIPFCNKHTVMLIFFPHRGNYDPYLHTLSKDIMHMSMPVLLANLKNTNMALTIPKFSMESKLKLQSFLRDMDLNMIFNNSAEFKHIFYSKDKNLKLHNIIQTVKIEVDEDGIHPHKEETTEYNLIINRPFIFTIVDLSTTEIIFSGRFLEPPIENNNIENLP